MGSSHKQKGEREMKLKKQSGFVIEGMAIVILSIAVGVISYFNNQNLIQKAEMQHQQQEIDNIKKGGVDDGRVDW